MSQRVALFAVLALGAALRFWNIGAGLPYRVGPDEPVIAEHAINMMRTGNFHPGFWDYPGLYIYVQLAVGCVRYVTGAMSGLWRSVAEFHPEHLFLWMRMLNAAIGTITIALVFAACTRWGRWTAVVAAAIFAVWPNHVRESHFALTDVPLTFFTVLTFVLALRAHDTGALRWFAAAGCCAGFAAATKYPGVYTLALPLIAAGGARTAYSVRLAGAGLTLLAAGAAFLVAAPYTVLDLPGFLNGFGVLSRYYRPRLFGDGASVYIAHLRAAIGWPGLAAVCAGILWGTYRAIRDGALRPWALAAIFPFIYFYAISTKYLIFGRYLLPMVPFLCLMMALVVVDGTGWIWRLRRPMRARAAILGVVLVITLFPVVKAGVSWPAQYGQRTTQDVAYERIREVIPAGSGVVVERSVLRLPDSLYRKTDVHRMIIRTPEDYVSKKTTFAVASSEAYGPVLERPAQFAADYQAYQRIFNQPGHCLPTIQPTATVPGPHIIICRFDAPFASGLPARSQ
jgi:4-amino-4-deoxy-L-arabinose transferase-like glycosyltransferase